MGIKELIKSLESFNQSLDVRIENTVGSPSYVGSWRGVYAWPALSYDECNNYGCTVGRLIAELRGALLITHEGYKGGNYVFHGDEPLHLDNYGNSSGPLITGAVERGGVVWLTTAQEP